MIVHHNQKNVFYVSFVALQLYFRAPTFYLYCFIPLINVPLPFPLDHLFITIFLAEEKERSSNWENKYRESQSDLRKVQGELEATIQVRLGHKIFLNLISEVN